jgi:hypothetical protein
MTLREMIQEAIVEAEIMEYARSTFSLDNMLLTAMRLSGAPYSFIERVYYETIADAA